MSLLDKPFDPNLHEAVAIDEESEFPPSTITEELLRGFRIGDSVIRHSMVKVSKAAPKEASISLEPEAAGEAADETDEAVVGTGPQIERPGDEETTAEITSVDRGDVGEADVGEDIELEDINGFSIERNGKTS